MKDKIGYNTFGDYIWQGTWLTLPLYPWFNDKTKQVYNRNIFRVMQEFETTFKELHDILDSYVKWRNTAFGSHCSNSEYYLVRDNKRFAFLIDVNDYSNPKSKLKNTFHIWDDFSQGLGDFTINPNEPPSDDFINWIENITKEYCENKIHCSDCGKEIINDRCDGGIAGRYFAGIYCKDCWERKWKAIEANGNYD